MDLGVPTFSRGYVNPSLFRASVLHSGQFVAVSQKLRKALWDGTAQQRFFRTRPTIWISYKIL